MIDRDSMRLLIRRLEEAAKRVSAPWQLRTRVAIGVRSVSGLTIWWHAEANDTGALETWVASEIDRTIDAAVLLDTTSAESLLSQGQIPTAGLFRRFGDVAVLTSFFSSLFASTQVSLLEMRVD